MRHRKKTIKLGRTAAHRDALLSSLVCNLIAYKRITTTLAKAKAARSLAERMVTLGKRGTLAARRHAISTLRQKERVAALFGQIAPAFNDRAGGYTRIIHLGRRASDSSDMALLEWVNYVPSPPKKKKEDKAKKAEGGTSAPATPAAKTKKEAETK
jgi:large subunit ribosomal protein L17